jgi:hypothetical protein
MRVLARLCRTANHAETILRKAAGCTIVGSPIVYEYRFYVTRLETTSLLLQLFTSIL